MDNPLQVIRYVTLRGAGLVVTLVGLLLAGPAFGQGATITLEANPSTIANGGGGEVFWAAPENEPEGTWVYTITLVSSGSVHFVTPGGAVRNGGLGAEQTVAHGNGAVLGVQAVTADTAATISGTVVFKNSAFQEIGSGTVEPVSIGVGSAPPTSAPPTAGFALQVDDMCPDDGDPVNVTLESEDPNVASYTVAVTMDGELTTTDVAGANGTFQFNAAGQVGQTIPIVAVAKDAAGNVVGMRSLKPEIGKDGCDGQDGEDDTGNPWEGGGNDGGAEDKFNRCQADIDCWCRRIKDDDSFWIVILKRALMPCPCNELHNDTPWCQMLQHVNGLLEWGPFGLVSSIITLKDTEPASKTAVGLPMFDFTQAGINGSGVSSAGISAVDWTIITGWSGWAWIRGLLGLSLYLGFASYLMDRLQPKQVL